MNPESPPPGDELDVYLDDQMSVHDRTAFERRLETEPDIRRELARRRSLQARLKTAFQPPVRSVEEIERWLPAKENEPIIGADVDNSMREFSDGSVTAKHRFELGWLLNKGPGWPQRAILWGAIAVSASIAWVLLMPNASQRPSVEPFFEPRNLAELYQETVAEGFRPYYFCEDAARFAKTFAKRQGVPLQLSPMAAGRTMVGLSYLGGLTRNTTAVLCRVDDQPVVVFVDRQESEPSAILDVPAGAKIFVHTRQLKGLVLFEVTPLSEPTMLEYLQVAAPD